MISSVSTRQQSADFVVIGGGIAGLRAAIGLAAAGRVVVLTKAEPTESNTGYAQGGIAAAVGPDDSPDRHAEDTLRAGDGLCDPSAVRVLVENGPRGVQELLEWGARFEREPGGGIALGREAAHSVRRVLHAGDATGREIGRVLWERVSSLRSVAVIDHALASELVLEDGRVVGVAYFDRSGDVTVIRAQATLVATGGAGQLFRETTNPAVASGDGIALAFYAGARLADLEFVQFHPTALDCPGAPRFLVSEALRGEGARLVNAAGEPFMSRYHHDAELAPRDIVARAIVRESERTGGRIFLTLAHLDPAFVVRRFPTVAEMCRRVGLDLARDCIPIGPAAHYVMGGIETDESARTSVPGLFAAGEVACTGVHGANRLASNSLLEGLVFGARAAASMQEEPHGHAGAPVREGRDGWKLAEAITPAELSDVPTSEDIRNTGPDEIRDLMWRASGLFRDRDPLTQAVARLRASLPSASMPAGTTDTMKTPEESRRRNLTTVAWLIARAALRREESRGSHFRADFPARDDIHWKVHLIDCLE